MMPGEARKFYGAIAVFTAAAVAMNFRGLNPMRALVWSGVVQGFSTPSLLLLIILITNNREVMGDKTNSTAINILGCITLLATLAGGIGLIVSWFM
jgi:Mn2+/Fe2+ NRAMP family transporter